jgi:Protein of unknown function (DUF2442)
MSSRTPGKNAPNVEVTNISGNGIWLWAKGKELFLAYKDFPWFKDASVGKIFNVKEPSSGHFYWPDLDVDLTADIIEHPERFPVKMH